MEPILAIVLAFVGSAITALVTYLLGVRGKSGKISTTEAQTLWSEAATMRGIYRDEAKDMRAEADALRDDVAVLRETAMQWQSAALRWRAELAVARGVKPDDLNEPAAISAVSNVLRENTGEHPVVPGLSDSWASRMTRDGVTQQGEGRDGPVPSSEPRTRE
jgi:hypothetical protein